METTRRKLKDQLLAVRGQLTKALDDTGPYELLLAARLILGCEANSVEKLANLISEFPPIEMGFIPDEDWDGMTVDAMIVGLFQMRQRWSGQMPLGVQVEDESYYADLPAWDENSGEPFIMIPIKTI